MGEIESNREDLTYRDSISFALFLLGLLFLLLLIKLRLIRTIVLRSSFTGIEEVPDLRRNLLKIRDRESTKEVPRHIQRGEDITSFIWVLREELSTFKLLFKVEETSLFFRQSFFTDDSLQGLGILTSSIVGIHLVRHRGMVETGHTLTDGTLHQTRKRRKHIDRRIDLTVVELTINENLTLRDVPGKIGDGMGDICV